MTGFWGGVAALLPPIGVGLVFWVVMRAILQADRRERAAMARLEAAEDGAKRATDVAGRNAGDAAAVPPQDGDAAQAPQSAPGRGEGPEG
jgi:hypothetical protein